MTNTAGDKLMQAINLASTLHHNQYRDATEGRLRLPYIVHPIAVLKLLWDWGVNDCDVLCAAVCHDLREDTAITHKELCDLLGKRVADIVEELTFIPPTNKDEKVAAKAQYIASFTQKSIEALAVKIADRLCNTNDFLIKDSKYALVYFHKADAIFDAWQLRIKEAPPHIVCGINQHIMTVRHALERLNL